MEKDFGSWFRHQRTDWPSPDLSPPCGQNTSLDYMNPCVNSILTNGNLPICIVPEVPHSKASQPNEPRNWFYCSSRFLDAFNPARRDKLPIISPKEISSTPVLNEESSKRFLVFDQSGDQTTLVFSSGIEGPGHVGFDLNKDGMGIKREKIYPSGPLLDSENHRDVESEMHEDTEELDALLYSDDDASDYSEDEEVTSSYHSPNKEEQVGSSGGPFKRQKLVDEACYEYENDAESCCDDTRNRLKKRAKIEKIRETISILQTIIPGTKSKDPIAALDDAIHYLRSLKAKANALGLDTL